MIYGKYKNIRNASWQCIIDYNITKLPISLVSIANKSNIQIVKNSVVNLLRATERGISVYDGEKWLIVYDDNIKTSVNRFTIAHEFGHIFLGHELKKGYYARTFDKNKPEVEQAADMFAARLLAPACVLHELQTLSAEQIAEEYVIYLCQRLRSVQSVCKYLNQETSIIFIRLSVKCVNSLIVL